MKVDAFEIDLIPPKITSAENMVIIIPVIHVSIQSFLELLLKLNDADEKDQKVQVKKGLNHRGYQNFF